MLNFVKIRSISREDIKIFQFFKMAAVAILHFRNLVKFCQNRSLHCGDIAIFRIFKMAAAAILDF